MNSHCCNSNFTDTLISSASTQQRGIADNGETKRSLWLIQGPSYVLSLMKNYLIRKHNQRIDRQAFNHLLALDESLLRDIGVTRQDVTWASNLPLSENASARLNEIARRL